MLIWTGMPPDHAAQHKLIISSGHDEYWSPMNGINLKPPVPRSEYFSAATSLLESEMENNCRTLVCTKKEAWVRM